jgi:hypothetical protein
MPETNLTGNAIDFFMRVLGLSFHDAMRQIYPVKLPFPAGGDSSDVAAKHRHKNSLRVDLESIDCLRRVKDDENVAISRCKKAQLKWKITL